MDLRRQENAAEFLLDLAHGQFADGVSRKQKGFGVFFLRLFAAIHLLSRERANAETPRKKQLHLRFFSTPS